MSAPRILLLDIETFPDVAYVWGVYPAAPQTLLHELLHLNNPSWSETQVRREAAREWRRMTWRQKAELLRMFGRAKIGEEERE